MELTDNQKQKIQNIEIVQGSIGLLGSIGGVIYSKRTGGGFWRGVGYFILGGLITGIPAALVSIPFKNKILSDADNNKDSNEKKASEDKSKLDSQNSLFDANEAKMNHLKWNDLLSASVQAKNRSKVNNQFADLINNPTLKDKFEKNFIQFVNNDEFKALLYFYNNYNKSLTDTFTKVTPSQKTLIQTGTAKIFGAI